MSELRYDPTAIEPKWQEVWARERTWEVSNEPDGRASYYVLEMLPYPSGEPHMGHLKNYALGDAVAHFNRRIGRRVLHPMGYDAFGLPAENHAIKTGVHPRDSTAASIESFQRQFRQWGISIDWTREFGTHEPRYYRWTQWLFLKLYERGLAYRKEAAVKWCPNDQTVLANEQVTAEGTASAAARVVEARQLEQWFFRITDYADRLLDDLATIEWPEHVKTMQRNWIGRSEGAEVTFRCEELGIDYPVFTTRPDTLFGATFFVMAPEHPDVLKLVAGTPQEQAVRDYVNHALTESNEERGDVDKAKTGVALGRTVTNPVNGEQIPMYVADYVLMEYGTGAIMAVPGHDERDFAFAQAYDLPIRRVIEGGDGAALQRRRPAREQPPRLRRDGQPRGARGDRRLARPRGQGPRLRQLPPARLARLAPALLGLPDPDRPLRRVRHGAGAGRGPAGRAARRHRLQAEGQVAARRRRGLGQRRRARRAAARPAARPTRWTRSSTRPGTSCATATRTTTRPRGTAGCSPSGCPSTSTSAASSTRSCTCCTRASSRRRSPTWSCSTRRSRSRRSSRRG